MPIHNKQKSSKNQIWMLFSSVKLSVSVLLLLAITSAAGTIIPQGENPENYIQIYGSFGYGLIQVLHLFDMYHSWWFRTLIGVLTINIIVCTINRWPTIWKTLNSSDFGLDSLSKKKPMQEFKEQKSSDELQPLYKLFLEKKYQLKGMHPRADGFNLYGEKGRWSRLGVPLVHLSIVLILAGSLVGSFWGFDGYVNIPEGGGVDQITLRDSKQKKALGFEVFCKDFNVSYYDSGAAKEFRSALQLKEGGKVFLEKEIIVNDPLRYQGINFFQSSYGPLSPENLELNIKSKESDKIHKYKVKIGESIELPNGSGQFFVKKFNRDIHFNDVEIGQGIEGELTLTDAKPIKIVLPFKYPTFDKMRKGEWIINIENYDSKFYTGLQVTYDPGVLFVYAGFMLILMGCWVIFFNSHQKILIEVISSSESSHVKIFGSTTRNKIDFIQQMEKFTDSLKKYKHEVF